MVTRHNPDTDFLSTLLPIALCIAICVTGLPDTAGAQGWQLGPVIRFGVESDDNATLNIRTDEEVSLSGLMIDARADVEYSSAKTSFSIQPRVTLRNYPDDPDFDSDDFFVRSDFSHEMQSTTIGFRAFFEQQSVRTAERAVSDPEIEDPDDITDDETGRILRFGDRNKWRISPNWSYEFSRISSIGVDVDYIDVQYDNVFEGLLEGYTDTRLNVTYRRSFSAVSTGLLMVTGRTYDPELDENDITGYGVLAGFEYSLSQKMRLRAMFGIEETDQSGFDYDREPVGFITLIRNLETIRMSAQYRRSVTGSGSGRLSVRDSIFLNFGRRLNERISAGLGVRAYNSEEGRAGITLEERTYIQLRSSFEWYLSRAWVIEADYRYTVNDPGPEVGERANSNQVNLWIVYQPKAISRP
jgi:hypothetical protein